MARAGVRGRLEPALAAAGLALWALTAAAGAAQRVALVIGNSAYEHVRALPNPPKDAADVGAALARLGFAVTSLDDTGYEDLRRGLLEFEEAAARSEIAVVFYAGHGIEMGGENYLVPVDARLERDRAVKHEAMGLHQVIASVEGASTLGMVILDACRDNPFAVRSSGMKRSVRRGLAPVKDADLPGTTIVAYAAKEGTTADDGKRGGNSPYTKALLKYLEEPGLELNMVFRLVHAEVKRETNGGQQPVRYGELPPEDVYLASAAVPPSPPKDAGTATAGGTPSSAAGDAARAYEAAERAGTVAAYRIVVGDFPNSTYAKLARTQIAKLEEKPKPIVVVGGDPGDDVGPVVPAPSPGEAARAYEAVERLDTVAAYRVFIRRFPGSYEAELARGHIAKLEGKPKPIIVAGGGAVEEVAPAAPSPEEVETELGLSGGDRRLVQMGLAAAGHDPGPVDGMLWVQTRRALRAWQESKEVEGTGYLTREQSEGLVALGREESERRRTEAEREAREAAERRRAEAERKRKAEERRRAETERKAQEAEERRRRARSPGTKFRDCPECPEMVVVPGGQFGHPFAVGVYEVTFGEWDACVSDRGCRGHRPDDNGWGRGRRPVMNVSWEDAQAYVRWLSGKTGKEYRLLSDAEWEYVARAGTRTRYWWGDEIGRNRANCAGCGDSYRYTAPVGLFSANPFGLHDVQGNVREWVEDCWRWGCSQRVVRGGSWLSEPWNLRSANSDGYPSGSRVDFIGFRVARTLTP